MEKQKRLFGRKIKIPSPPKVPRASSVFKKSKSKSTRQDENKPVRNDSKILLDRAKQIIPDLDKLDIAPILTHFVMDLTHEQWRSIRKAIPSPETKVMISHMSSFIADIVTEVTVMGLLSSLEEMLDVDVRSVLLSDSKKETADLLNAFRTRYCEIHHSASVHVKEGTAHIDSLSRDVRTAVIDTHHSCLDDHGSSQILMKFHSTMEDTNSEAMSEVLIGDTESLTSLSSDVQDDGTSRPISTIPIAGSPVLDMLQRFDDEMEEFAELLQDINRRIKGRTQFLCRHLINPDLEGVSSCELCGMVMQIFLEQDDLKASQASSELRTDSMNTSSDVMASQVMEMVVPPSMGWIFSHPE